MYNLFCFLVKKKFCQTDNKELIGKAWNYIPEEKKPPVNYYFQDERHVEEEIEHSSDDGKSRDDTIQLILANEAIKDDLFINKYFLSFFNRLNSKGSGYLWLFVIYVTITPLIPVVWAYFNDVLFKNDEVDYPLSYSYATWLGDFFLGGLVIYTIKVYMGMPKLFDAILNDKILSNRELSEKEAVEEKRRKVKYISHKFEPSFIRYIILFISFGASWVMHDSFTKDKIFGWCELSVDSGLSYLGYYHLVEVGAILFIYSYLVSFSRTYIKELKHFEIGYSPIILLETNSYKEKFIDLFQSLVNAQAKLILYLGCFYVIFILGGISLALRFDAFYSFQLIQLVITSAVAVFSIMVFLDQKKVITTIFEKIDKIIVADLSLTFALSKKPTFRSRDVVLNIIVWFSGLLLFFSFIYLILVNAK